MSLLEEQPQHRATRARKSRSRAVLHALLAVQPLFVSTRALAGDDAPSAAENASPNDGASHGRDLEAKALFDRAQETYMGGDLVSALRLLEKSYEVSHRAELLFNLGQLNQELDRCRPALEHYQRYLELLPKAGRRAEAQSAIARLTEECSAPPAGDATLAAITTLEAEATPSYWTARNALAWSAIATGVLAEAGALYFALSARGVEGELERIANTIKGQPLGTRATWDSAAQNKQAEGERDQNLALALGLGGATLLAGGIIVLTTTPDRLGARPAAQLLLLRGGVCASYSVVF
jgi:tetratricopeptide (TPR) repeat protein